MTEKTESVNKESTKLANFKGKSHTLTKQDRIKAGKSIGNRWDKIRNCTNKCPYWDSCNYHTKSQTETDGRCYVKNLPELAVRSFVRLQSGKESEYNKMCMEYLDDFVNDQSISKQDKLTAIMKMGPVVYGSKIRQKVSQDEGTEFVVRFKKEGEK